MLYQDLGMMINYSFFIKGAELEKVKNVLNQILAAHEAFHSYYGEENGIPVRILTDALPEITVKAAETLDEVIDLIDNYAVPFDLEAEIPIRPILYHVADGSVILHLAAHHIAFDGCSATPFMHELMDGLNGKEIKASETDLSALYRQSVDVESGLSFYREMFQDGVPVNDMPIRGKRPKTHPIADKQIRFSWDKNMIGLIGAAAKKYGMTSFELIFSAVSMVLGKYTSSQDVVWGVPTNMRPQGAEDVIGMFVNTAPVRVKPVRKSELSDYFTAVSETVRKATRRCSLPFETVVAEFVKQRDDSRNPIFDVSLNYLRVLSRLEQGGISLEC